MSDEPIVENHIQLVSLPDLCIWQAVHDNHPGAAPFAHWSEWVALARRIIER